MRGMARAGCYHLNRKLPTRRRGVGTRLSRRGRNANVNRSAEEPENISESNEDGIEGLVDNKCSIRVRQGQFAVAIKIAQEK
jgi:hypothetical protein